MNAIIAFAASLCLAGAASAAPGFSFNSIDGTEMPLSDYRGGPVLVVNTASECGYTGQYEGLQDLYGKYQEAGLTVIAVPSDAFNQELSSNEAVKDFCAVNYGLTLPMTEITEVKGADAHPFYIWLRQEHGFTPTWNFNKVLLDGEGEYLASWGASTRPLSGEITGAVEQALPAK